jgi:High potential iron-sulfur protein
MVEKIDGGIQLLLTTDEADLFDQQVKAQASGDVKKMEADYQNEPNDDEQCDQCKLFVPGFPDDIAGYCSKVVSFKGPLGMIFSDGWCRFFERSECAALE